MMPAGSGSISRISAGPCASTYARHAGLSVETGSSSVRRELTSRWSTTIESVTASTWPPRRAGAG